jgi:hypothetical protein
MAVILKKVKVKRMVYSFNTTSSFVNQYITGCINVASRNALYESPNIDAAFYTKGINAATAIQTATTKYASVPLKSNLGKLKNTKKAAILWLHDFSDKVELIANDDANRDTRNEAATNIAAAFLTAQKLANASKGKPQTPKITAKSLGNGKVDVEILNNADYNPTLTMFVIIEKSAKAKLTLNNGQLDIKMENISHVIFKVANEKGKYTHLKDLKRGVKYEIYAYAQNGKNKLSDLSNAAIAWG